MNETHRTVRLYGQTFDVILRNGRLHRVYSDGNEIRDWGRDRTFCRILLEAVRASA